MGFCKKKKKTQIWLPNKEYLGIVDVSDMLYFYLYYRYQFNLWDY